MYNEWVEAVHKAARDSIGEVRSGVSWKKGKKVSPELSAAMQGRRKARRAETLGRKKRNLPLSERQKLKRESRQAVKKAKEIKKKEVRTARDEFMAIMDGGSAQGIKKFWKYWANLKKDGRSAEKKTRLKTDEKVVSGRDAVDALSEHLNRLNTPVDSNQYKEQWSRGMT